MADQGKPHWELRHRKFPRRLHLKIEKYAAQALDREDRSINKDQALEEIVERGTKGIKVPA
jgi:phage gp46-like protein